MEATVSKNILTSLNNSGYHYLATAKSVVGISSPNLSGGHTALFTGGFFVSDNHDVALFGESCGESSDSPVPGSRSANPHGSPFLFSSREGENISSFTRSKIMTRHISVVTPETIPQIHFKDQPVLTTALLAQLYGTRKTNIYTNYRKNKSRFTVGKHLFALNPSETQCFKMLLSETQQAIIPPSTPKLTLWTERGAARHAKMLNTDQAWDVFERLEECYFERYPRTVNLPVATISPEQQREVQKLVAAIVHGEDSGKSGFAKVYGKIKDRFKVPSYKDVPKEEYKSLVSFIHELSPTEVRKTDTSLSHLDPALVSLLARCSKRQIAQISSLLGIIMSGVKYRMKLDY